MFFQKKTAPVWLIVGLGNPGEQYQNTRHNAGFLAVDELARRENFTVQKVKFHALTGTAQLGGQSALILKPVTYMNLSGQAVGEAARFYQIPADHVLVISDDVDLSPGRLRIRKSGSAGGHNGLKSIIQHLGTDQFPRLRIGVGGKPHPDYDMADWVLGKPQGQDQKDWEQAISRAADAVVCLLSAGIDRAMNQYNN